MLVIPSVFFPHRLYDLSDCIRIIYPVIAEAADTLAWEARHLWNYNDEVVGGTLEFPTF